MLMITKSSALHSYVNPNLLSNCLFNTSYLDVYQVFQTWHVQKALLISVLPSTPAPSLFPCSVFPILVQGSSILPEPHSQNLEDIFDYSLFIHHIYQTHQQILPNISISITSSAHILTQVSTISYAYRITQQE